MERGDFFSECVAACYECAQACSACADACLAEDQIDAIRRCIRLTLDCADLCETTGHVLSRQREPDSAIVRRQLETLTMMCRKCAAECHRHADAHAHCRLCMEACRICEETCERLLGKLGGPVATQAAWH